MSKYIEVQSNSTVISELPAGWYRVFYSTMKPDLMLVLKKGTNIIFDTDNNKKRFSYYINNRYMSKEDFKVQLILQKSKVWRALYG